MNILAKFLSTILTPEGVIEFATSIIVIVLKKAVTNADDRVTILSAAETMVEKVKQMILDIRIQAGLLPK